MYITKPNDKHSQLNLFDKYPSVFQPGLEINTCSVANWSDFDFSDFLTLCQMVRQFILQVRFLKLLIITLARVGGGYSN